MLMDANRYGLTKDDATAVEWYQKAADQGDANAKGHLARMYEKGDEVPQNLESYQTPTI